ncbi:MAG: 7-cyano-7-deazaguanine synthase [Candidatus Bathyarchaeota archaeon]
MNKKPKAVAVVSGGLDSICYTVQWQAKGYSIYPIIFCYAQKGYKEVQVARRLCGKLKFEQPKIVNISFMLNFWRKTQLTDVKVKVKKEYEPTVVVPLRNAVFLTIAAVYAYSIGANVILYGAQSDDVKMVNDEPLYPDCSLPFISSLEEMLNKGHIPSKETKVTIWCPNKEGMDKARNLICGYRIIGKLVYNTWSCYLSKRYHCGSCESCVNRHKAFILANIPDKTKYEHHPVVDEKCKTGECGVK